MNTPKILLYYAFQPVADPHMTMLWQKELCERLGLRGRIIISKHGINGTVGGEIDACKQYLRRTKEVFNLDTKWSDGTEFEPHTPEMIHGVDRHPTWRKSTDFPKLSVKVRDELVAFGLPDETVVDANGVVGGGEHLTPERVNELVAERGDEVVFFDGRNAWEAEIGKFKNAIVPEVRTTHDFMAEIESGKYDELKDRPIVTYCTGGIRCEILSAAMINRGFNEVYQIDGGIVRYGEKYGNDGLWEGSLAVFDARESIDFAPGAKLLGKCSVCGSATNQLANCSDLACRKRFVLCDAHLGAPCPDHSAAEHSEPAPAAATKS